MNISTKIQKGQIEIVTDVSLIKEGERVTASQAALLQKLNIMPFSFGLKVETVYDNGSVYDAAVLDITDEALQAKFLKGVQNVAAMSLGASYPTAPSLPHLMLNAFKNCAALVLDSEYTFKQMEPIKKFLENPGAFAAAAPAASAAAPAAAAKKEEVKEEEEEEGDFGMSLFD